MTRTRFVILAFIVSLLMYYATFALIPFVGGLLGIVLWNLILIVAAGSMLIGLMVLDSNF